MKLSEEQKEKRRQYYRDNKQKFIDKAKKWKKENPEKARASTRKSQNARPRETIKIKWLKQEYNLSWEEYTTMYADQKGQCKICKTSIDLRNDKSGGKTAHVDHCHTTGAVRGLLCNKCNRGIGYLQDSPTILRLAAEYLDASR